MFTGLHAPQIEARVAEKKPDGSLGRTSSITKETLIGREGCDLNYPQDTLLSTRHAALSVRANKLWLRDLASQNGSFYRQREDSPVVAGDVFLLGRELFRFTTETVGDAPPQGVSQGTMVWSSPPRLQPQVAAKLEHIKLNGEVLGEFKLEKPETTLGRTTGDLTFKEDPYMSSTHARIVNAAGQFFLQDLHSRNGVYRRVRDEVELRDADEFFMGEQLFRVEVKTS